MKKFLSSPLFGPRFVGSTKAVVAGIGRLCAFHVLGAFGALTPALAAPATANPPPLSSGEVPWPAMEEPARAGGAASVEGIEAARLVDARRLPETVQRTTPHYRLFVQGDEAQADKFAAILEQCWTAFRDFFKSEPVLKEGERLTIRVYKSLAEWEQGTLDDRAAAPARAAPAWYCARTQTAYVHELPSEYNTRAILIYAACLQFHGLAKYKNLDLDWAWYLHGIAESFSVHAWDGTRLELARHPKICMTDYPGLALKVLGGQPAGVEFWNEEVMKDAYVRWCVVRFAEFGVKGKYRPQFQKLALGYTGSKVSGEDFVRTLGQKRAITQEFGAWLLLEQFPFEVMHGEWEEYDDGRVDARASTETFALCCAKEKLLSIEAIVENVRDLQSTAAVVLSYSDGLNYVIGRIVPPLVMIEWIHNGRAVSSNQLSFGRMEIDNVRVKARRDGTRVRLNVDGRDLDSVEVPDGRLGFAAMGRPIVFRDMKAR